MKFFPALALLPAVISMPCRADTIGLSVMGNTAADVWGADSLTATANPGFPGALNFSQPWPSPIPATLGDGYLQKTANGLTGAPIPSGQSIYFVSFSNAANVYGGKLAAFDDTPLTGLSTLAFQVEIGGSNGYDFLDNDLTQPPNLSAVKLNYTTTDGATGSLEASSHAVLDRFYTFAIDMPIGPNGENLPADIYNQLYGLQWDLSGIGPIASYHIEFSGTEHAQIYQLRIDQTDHAYGTASAFPQDAIWTAAGTDEHWEIGLNWQEQSVPDAGRNLRFSLGNGAILASDPIVKSLNFNTSDSFTLRSEGDASLTLLSGINSNSPGTVSHEISTSLHLSKYNLIEIGAGNSLTLSGPLTGAGFYKQGVGTFHLTGSNSYNGSDESFLANGLIFRDGLNSITGTNAISGNATTTFNLRPETTVRLHGGNQRLDANFTANLLGTTSVLILGDETGASDQSFFGLTGSVGGAPVIGSKIVGGSPDSSTLTTHVPSGSRVFAGDLGGSGPYENHLNLVKTGDGLQILSGNHTFTGTTLIRGGALAIDPANRRIQLDGGVLVLDGRDYEGNLGDQPGEIHFTAAGGFAANGPATTSSTDASGFHRVSLNNGDTLGWGNTGFLANGNPLILSAAGTNQTLDLTNPLDLGASSRVIQIADSLHSTDARLNGALSGTGSFEKTGAGLLELTAANSFTGTARLHAGTTVLTGVNGTLTGGVIVEGGASFRLTNTTQNRNHRLQSTAPVTLRGGIFTFTAAATGTTEQAGTLFIEKGANTLSTSRANVDSSTLLTFDQLTREAGSTLNFSGTSIGLPDARNRVIFQTPPILKNRLIGGWAVTGNEFATYDSTHGVTAFTNYSSPSETLWTASENVRLTTAATLTGDRALHSLRLVGATSGTVRNVIDLAENQLHIASGGILTSGGSDTRATAIDNGILTAGSDGDPAPELLVTSNGVAEIGATIADLAGIPLSLVKSGSQVLTLRGNNSHTGTTTINQGTLKIAATGSIASSPLIRINPGATLNVADFSAPFEIAASQKLTGTGTLTGPVTISGVLAPEPSFQNTLTFSNSLAMATGSTLEIRFDTAGGAATAARARVVSGSAGIAAGTRLLIAAPQIDFTSAFWKTPRSFPILTAPAFEGDYAASRPLVIDSNSTPAPGLWTVSYGSDTIALDWAPVVGIAAWRTLHFQTTEATGTAADLADPDGDGLVNLIEYALGTLPLSADGPTAAPALTDRTDRIGLTFEIPAEAPADLTYEVQVSGDLTDWKTLSTRTASDGWLWNGEGATQIETALSSGKTRITIGDETISPATGKRFLRLKVSH